MEETLLTCPPPCKTQVTIALTTAVFFSFEDDFVEENVRCIPMIVRFKLDACGIKLKLSEWSRMVVEERKLLAEMDCGNSLAVLQYRSYLQQLVMKRTGTTATELPVIVDPAWANTSTLPAELTEKAAAFGWYMSLHQWRGLSSLQRFVLLKLCKPGHEHKNFPKAYKEFGLV